MQPGHGSSEVEWCARERERLRVIQKRLELQKESILLEKEMIEADKLNLKKNVKLATKSKTLELQNELETLRAKVRSYKEKEKIWEHREKEQAASVTAARIAADDLSAKLNLEVLELESQLKNSKREQVVLEKNHEVEKEKWEKGMIDFIKHEAALRDNAKNSQSDEEMRLGRIVENLEAETIGLREENQDLKRSLSDFESRQKRNEAVETAALEKANEKLNVLREQWKQEKEVLEMQFLDQNRQIDDWKLSLPRNQVELKQTMMENKQLMKELKEARKKEDFLRKELEEVRGQEQSARQELAEVQSQDKFDSDSGLGKHLTTLKTEQRHDVQRFNSIDAQTVDMQTVDMQSVISERDQSSNSGPAATAASVSTVAIFFTLPHDLSEASRRQMKFVIEWEWSRFGLYTGWLDLDGNPNGSGTLRMANGDVYIGDWKHGRRAGAGACAHVNGDFYYGSWLNDEYHGRGVFVTSTNQIYSGDWKNGARHGFGIETWLNGARYVGNYYEDTRDTNNSRGV
mmetsp:Transcript_15102/g.31077  ORF Transcript_15102/g.31077 Transcript_15102/m.31077 type:complete len:517 (+) Transcript_15102:269-1819(+)|eukprot:CAMPEP_0201117694 /NCGR_PEP_ID=MMETSP0850-20130426/1691_1 /ASSEMBLY_ACC=CAM_ASM_000622 /TAXON_ID=183588 /ORGANISM="Pseudo-nitzschia fraudulenta, Strain WWA7" /LENGTH=516 /DNA_ID=CAMNT_0047382213 /DNA_START=100 /DNA_END=1650 /DNA_ORIENTATION=+